MIGPRATRRSWVVVLAAGATLLGGCSSSSPSAVDPASSEAGHIAGLFWLMLWIAVGIYVLVLGFVVASFRSRRPAPEAGPAGPRGWAIPAPTDAGDRRRTRRFIVLGGLALPVVALVVVGIATVRTTNALEPGPSSVRIDVRAERWWWRLTYPGEHVVTANEIHVPVGEPVELTLTSDNVVHSLWVPELDGKTDVIPGETTHMTFTADTPGTYRGQCAEFCGLGHALMAFIVIVDAAPDYAAWLRSTAGPAAPPTDDAADRGATYFATNSCAGCHTVQGTAAVGDLGPDLTHFGSRRTIGADTLPNTPGDLAHWLADTQGVKPGALMPQLDLTADQISDLVAYLEALS